MRSAVPEIAAPALSRLPPPPTYSTERDRPPMSCRYFGQSAALAPTPAADDAAVASTATAAALMKNDRRCFNVPPGVRLTAVVVDGLPQPIGKRRRRAPTEHPVGLCAVERES